MYEIFSFDELKIVVNYIIDIWYIIEIPTAQNLK